MITNHNHATLDLLLIGFYLSESRKTYNREDDPELLFG